MKDNIEYLQALDVQRRFFKPQKNSLVMATLYIYKCQEQNTKLKNYKIARFQKMQNCKKRLMGGEKCQSTMYLP